MLDGKRWQDLRPRGRRFGNGRERMGSKGVSCDWYTSTLHGS